MKEDGKNWVGDTNAVFSTLGASSHSSDEREVNDYYATDPKAGEMLVELEGEHLSDYIWEPSCGEGHLSEVFIKNKFSVVSSDLVDRGYGTPNINFLECNKKWKGSIVTNPPYKFAQDFVEKSLELVEDGALVCMFLKIQFLEGKKRKALFLENPPRRVWISSSRIACAKNGDFEKMKKQGSAVGYAWYVWEKGYKGDTVVKWFN